MKKPCSLTIVAVTFAMASPYAVAACNSWGLPSDPQEVPLECAEALSSCLRTAESDHDRNEWICAVADTISLGDLCNKVIDELQESAEAECWDAYTECVQDSCVA